MTGEIRTLSLTVDLECRLCSKMIKKAICKLQKRERIQKVEYDEKGNKVTISGPFDPVKLKNKLCCKACEAIKSINIVEEKKQEPKKKKIEKKEEPKKPVEKTPPESGTKKPEPIYLPFWPVGPPMPICRWCNDICRCCTCGCGGVGHHSLPVVGKPVMYQFSSEEAPPQCSIM